MKVETARWWRGDHSGEPSLTIGRTSTPDSVTWQVSHYRTWPERVGGPWLDEASARCWLWLALAIVPWHLVQHVDVARETWGSELDAVEARLRRALEGVSA